MIISTAHSQGLIGQNMFAIDGCKISSNCSKEWSGTKQELFNKTKKLEKSVTNLIQKHKMIDKSNNDDSQQRKEEKAIRDVRFEDAGKHKKKVENWKPKKGKNYFRPEDFTFDESGRLICPAGQPMKLRTPNVGKGGNRYHGKCYRSDEENCRDCSLRSKCIRKETTKIRQVSFLKEASGKDGSNPVQEMKDKIDTPNGRSIYSKRMSTVKPVFGHIRGMKHLDHFTMRGRQKVKTQWLLFCMVHNIGKMNKCWC